MNEDKLRDVLKAHKAWLEDEEAGQRADLHGADLRGVDYLREADLREADLIGADLRKADLRDANLDFSVWPLWCGSLGVNTGKALAVQLLYHALDALKSVRDDPEVCRVLDNPDVLTLANRFHRVSAGECKRLRPCRERKPKKDKSK